MPVVRSFEVEDRFVLGTLPFRRAHLRSASSRSHVSKTIIGLGFAAIGVLTGVVIGSVIVFTDPTRLQANTEPVAAPQPVNAPIATITPIEPDPAPVTVRIESAPLGATAMLACRGKTTLVGVTPLDAQLDPSLQYDLIVTLENHETHIEHLDPSKSTHVVVELASKKSPAKRPLENERVSERGRKAPLKERADERGRAEPGVAPPGPPNQASPRKVQHHRAPVAHADPVDDAAVDTGTLKVSSKPPCSIVIDGKATGLTTPKISIPLPAGRHEITLINTEAGIRASKLVEIRPNHSTLLIQDFMK
jgi:serine/threonine-protein kinase